MKNKMSILLMFLLSLSGVALAQQTSISRQSDDSTWSMTHSDNGHELRIRVKGKAEFNDDYSALVSLSAGGSLNLRETNNSQTRRIEITADNNGALKQSYFVNDAARAFDDEARRWMATIMLDLVRQSGFDAERRVARLFQKGGAEAVLKEVTLMRGDYGRRIYFSELLKQQPLDSATVQRILNQVAQTMSSAYEKRQVLTRVAERYLDDAAIRSEFIAAVGTINSAYERAEVLLVLLKHPLTPEQQAAVLQASVGIKSDYEKARVLIRLLETNPVAQPSLFAALDDMRSDYERSRVLLTLLSKTNPAGELLKLAIKAAAKGSSDYEKARVLVQIASRSQNDREIREALIEAARTITSDYERGRVLSAAVR